MSLERIERIIREAEEGFVTETEALDELGYAIGTPGDNDDPELAETLLRVLEYPGIDTWVVGRVAHSAFSAMRTGWVGGPGTRPLAEVRTAVAAHVATVFEAGATPVERAELLGALPPQWCDEAMVDSLLAEVEGPDRVEALCALFGALRHHKSNTGAFQVAVRPALDADDSEAADLVFVAYLAMPVDDERQYEMREYFSRHLASLGARQLLALAVRLSIERADERAVECARAALEAGLPGGKTPVAGIVLWIAGERDEALAAANAFVPVAQGWWSEAAASCALFIRASAAASAEERLALLAPPGDPGRRRIRRPATVAALVGRLALMRMEAFADVDRWDDAIAEAESVIAYHDFRRCILHMQGGNFEFDMRLLNRLAVTPSEVGQARGVVEAHPEIEPHHPFLYEGQLLWDARG